MVFRFDDVCMYGGRHGGEDYLKSFYNRKHGQRPMNARSSQMGSKQLKERNVIYPVNVSAG